MKVENLIAINWLETGVEERLKLLHDLHKLILLLMLSILLINLSMKSLLHTNQLVRVKKGILVCYYEGRNVFFGKE